MPQLISTTDEIGVRQGRDILFLSFRNMPDHDSLDDVPWEQIPERQAIIRWLEEHRFGWEMCIHCSPGTLIAPYRGAIYLDVVPESASDRYLQLLEFLEDECGQCRFSGVDFCLLPLEMSLKLFEQRQDRSE